MKRESTCNEDEKTSLMPHEYDPVCIDGPVSRENSRSSPPPLESQYSEIQAADLSFSKGDSRSRSVSPDAVRTAGIRKSYGAVDHEAEESPYSYVNVGKKRYGGVRSKKVPLRSSFPSDFHTSESPRLRATTSILQV